MRKYLDGCLESIYKYTENINYEIIVVDNLSDDGTIEMMESKYKDVILIKEKSNRGVSISRNIVLKRAQGRYIAILDADTELVENSFYKIIKYLEDNNDIGLIGPKLIYSNGGLQYTCRKYHNLLVTL